MTKNPRFLLPALVLTLGLSVAGCGGDDEPSDAAASDTPSTSDSPSVPDPTEAPDQTDAPAAGITKEALIEQGNQLCEAGNAAIDAASDAIDTADPATIVPFITGVLVPGVRAQITALRALGYPEGDEETLSGIYDDAEAVLDEIEADPEAAIASEDPFAEVNAALDGLRPHRLRLQQLRPG